MGLYIYIYLRSRQKFALKKTPNRGNTRDRGLLFPCKPILQKSISTLQSDQLKVEPTAEKTEIDFQCDGHWEDDTH